jgi:hypothetical protein
MDRSKPPGINHIPPYSKSKHSIAGSRYIAGQDLAGRKKAAKASLTKSPYQRSRGPLITEIHGLSLNSEPSG